MITLQIISDLPWIVSPENEAKVIAFLRLLNGLKYSLILPVNQEKDSCVFGKLSNFPYFLSLQRLKQPNVRPFS